MNADPTEKTPTIAELASLAALIVRNENSDKSSEWGYLLAVDQAWILWRAAAGKIEYDKEQKEAAVKAEEERLAGLVPFSKIPGYVTERAFEDAVRRAIAHFKETPPATLLVLDGFVAKAHVDILDRYKRDLARVRQDKKRQATAKKKKPTSNKKTA